MSEHACPACADAHCGRVLLGTAGFPFGARDVAADEVCTLPERHRGDCNWPRLPALRAADELRAKLMPRRRPHQR